jgi:hypothetical protein
LFVGFGLVRAAAQSSCVAISSETDSKRFFFFFSVRSTDRTTLLGRWRCNCGPDWVIANGSEPQFHQQEVDQKNCEWIIFFYSKIGGKRLPNCRQTWQYVNAALILHKLNTFLSPYLSGSCTPWGIQRRTNVAFYFMPGVKHQSRLVPVAPAPQLKAAIWDQSCIFN